MSGRISYSLKINDVTYDINKKSGAKTIPRKIKGALASFFSKDMKYFYNIGSNALNKYDGVSFSLINTYKLMSQAAYFSLSPDNNYFAAETLSGTICILELNNGSYVYRKKISDREHGNFFFTGDSSSLVYASSGKIILVDFMH